MRIVQCFLFVLMAGCISGPERRSSLWTAGGVAPGIAVGATTGVGAYLMAARSDQSTPEIVFAGLAGALVGGVGGYALGECARTTSKACRIAVIAGDSIVGFGVGGLVGFLVAGALLSASLGL